MMKDILRMVSVMFAGIYYRSRGDREGVLGPLYLLIIGLPSFLWASLKRAGLFRGRDYYSFYTEKWADRLAGIER